MVAPPSLMSLLLGLLMTMMLSEIVVVNAGCRAPLTLMLTVRNYWEAWIGNTFYEGPRNSDQRLGDYSDYERVTNITVYVERSVIAIGVRASSGYASFTSLMASVSYNGVKLATTGDAGSRWKYTTDFSEINNWASGSNMTDDSLWSSVETIAWCDNYYDVVPSMNYDRLVFSEFISANGVTPARDSLQFGGETARWIGINENKGDCSLSEDVVYRMTLDLTALVDEPICFAEDDGRALLSPHTPIIGLPSIGFKSPTSQVVTFVGSIDGTIDIWVDGTGAEGRRGFYADTSEDFWTSFNHMEFNVEPKAKNLVAIHVKPWFVDHKFIANILYNGQLFAASDNLAQWKLFIARELMFEIPEEGWNTDPNYDDSTWLSMSETILCNSTTASSKISMFLNKTYGGCANWFWHNSGCEQISDYTNLYVRISMDLVDLKERPALECSMPSLDNPPKNSPTTPGWTPSDLEIVAIASSATLGSLMMIAAYLYVRRYRSRRSKTNMPSSGATTTKMSNMAPPLSSKWSFWPTTRTATTSHSSRMHLASLAGVDVSSRPHLMGELEKSRNLRADDQPGQIARTAILHTNTSANSLSELIKAYQNKQRSTGLDKLKLQQSDQSATRTMTHGTRTEFTLVDGTTQGLEIPGFLQLKEGVDFNLVDEYAMGGGGSLFSGRMFARGLPTLNVIVKKMTNASLPAFRQEVALMWLFNDNVNVVKLMGFNETQLAIVMPEYEMGSLKRFIDARDFDNKVARSLLSDIANGLSALHERGVVHNDIKPDNILLETHPTRRVRALLTDFGISNVVEDKVLTVKAFEVNNKGGLTVGYAAPEAIIRFRNKDFSRVPPGEAKAGDVYSFAVVIHALLAHLRLP